MEISLINPKEEIRGHIVDYFTSLQDQALIIYGDDFLDFLMVINKMTPKKTHIIMNSIFYDVYEFLKWKAKIRMNDKGERDLLRRLDAASTTQEVTEVAFGDGRVYKLLASLYYLENQLLTTKISAKNNILNAKVNNIILEADGFRKIENMSFYQKGYIFDKEYNKRQYIDLYDSLYKEYHLKSWAQKNFNRVIGDLKYYNKCNYKSLILDMCAELIIRNEIVGNYDKTNYIEDYLNYVIKYADVNRIVEVITDNEPIMSALTSNYVVNAGYYDEKQREQIEYKANNTKVGKVLKKLREGSK